MPTLPPDQLIRRILELVEQMRDEMRDELRVETWAETLPADGKLHIEIEIYLPPPAKQPGA